MQLSHDSRHKNIIGTTTQGRLGLGCITRAMWREASVEERRHLVQEEIRQTEEEQRMARAVGMAKQGAWTRWEDALQRKLTWDNIWKMEDHRIKFLLKSVYDVLPTPANLHKWSMEDPRCIQCGRHEAWNTFYQHARLPYQKEDTIGGMTRS